MVSTCWTRSIGISVRVIRERAVAEVDLLVADLVAPARPAQLRDGDRRRSRSTTIGSSIQATPPGASEDAGRRPRRAPRRSRSAPGRARASARRARGGERARASRAMRLRGRDRAARASRALVLRAVPRLRHRRLRLRRRAPDRAPRARRLDRRARSPAPTAPPTPSARAAPSPSAASSADLGALVAGMEGADVCFHAAAKVEDFGPWKAFVRGQRRGHPQRPARLPRRRRSAARSTSAPRRC